MNENDKVEEEDVDSGEERWLMNFLGIGPIFVETYANLIKLICLNPLFWGKFRLQSLVALHKISLKNSSVKNIFRARLNYCHSLLLGLCIRVIFSTTDWTNVATD